MLASSARGPEHFHIDVGVIDLDINFGQHRPHLHRGKTGLAPALVVERADSHQAVGAAFACQQAISKTSAHGEIGRQNSGFGAVRDIAHLKSEIATLSPTGVHAQQHRTPVLGVDAAVLGIDLHNGIRFVVFADEQTAEFHFAQSRPRTGDALGNFGFLRCVVCFASHFVQHLHVFQHLSKPVELGEVTSH